MNPLDLLRARRRDRAAEASRTYWNAIDTLAKGPSEKAASAAVAELERIAGELNKTPDDIEADVTAMRELRDLEASNNAKSIEAMTARFSAVDRKITAAAQRLDEAQREHDSAIAERQALAGERGALMQVAERIALVRRQLKAAGAPAEVLKL